MLLYIIADAERLKNPFKTIEWSKHKDQVAKYYGNSLCISGFRLGGLLPLLRMVGLCAVDVLVVKPWLCSEEDFLSLFKHVPVDEARSQDEELCYSNFQAWLKSVRRTYTNILL